jgi:ceramide glucosyltransferase
MTRHIRLQKVSDKYPDRSISLVVEKCNAGLNPKVNNLIPAYRKAQYPYVLISDSNVVVDKNYLREITRHTSDPSVGLVSNLIRGIGGRSLGALFENLHLNSFIIGGVSFLDRFLGMPCVVGKSMLMKKDDLEALGGLVALRISWQKIYYRRECRGAGKSSAFKLPGQQCQ